MLPIDQWTPLDFALAALGVLIVGVIAFFVIRFLRRRSAEQRRLALIAGGSADHLQNVLVPDGNGGHFHCDFLLLTSRGIVIIDLRNVRGNVFGGDQMTEWTVMNRGERTTFPNPHSSLYDRIAAVKAVVRDVPVEGRVVFSRRAMFPKGFPKWTLKLESLAAEFPALDAAQREAAVARYRPAWDALKGSTRPSSLHIPRAIE